MQWKKRTIMIVNPTLRTGSTLRGGKFTYTIQSVLGQGSFGITYLATTKTVLSGPLGNIETEVKVAIKEFFMKEFSSRREDGTITEMTGGSLVQNYARKFRKEAENLAKLSHPGIVNVLEVFDANNTCYYAMQYISGGSLDKYVKSRGGLPEQEAVGCIRQIGEAVQYMHDHRMLHLDLKPGNVMRSDDGSRMVLIDFGLSKQYTSNGEPESSTTIGLGTPGYAPLEQSKSDRDKEFAPTLDVYALGATFYKLLTGMTPPDSSDVLNEGLPVDILESKGVSQTSISAIERAMEPRKPKRVKSIAEFLTLLPASVTEETTRYEDDPTEPVNPKPAPGPTPEPAPQPTMQPQPDLTPSARRFPKWLLGVLGGFAVVAAVYFIGLRSRQTPVDPVINQSQTEAVVNQTETAVTQPQPASTTSPNPVQPTSQPTSQPDKPSKPTSGEPSPSVVSLESISLSKTSLTLDEGATSTLSVKYSPSNATDKSTTWKSTDASVAKVNSNGKVTAVKSGSAAIIATCQGKDAYCNVTVRQKPQEVEPSKQSQTASTSAPSSAASSTTGTHNGHEWVDLGLSVKWATCNVGASTPSDYGSYFAWGETSPKSSYDWVNLKYCTSGTYENAKFSKYVLDSQYGPVDNRTTLDLSDDAARANWGGSWRMPTDAEFRELINKCTWTWTTVNGKNGYKVVSKVNGNSIFLPAAGYRSLTSLSNAGSYGSYWSGSLYESYSNNARDLSFFSGNRLAYNSNRRNGRSVRPVLR